MAQPGAAEAAHAFQNKEMFVRTMLLQVMSRSNPRESGANNQYIDKAHRMGRLMRQPLGLAPL